MSHRQDSGGEKKKPCRFGLLMSGNFPHIWEKIFLTLDYESFKTCLRVCKTWAEVLRSEPFNKKAQSVFGASMWLDTEHLERAVYPTDKKILRWTANVEEVAFIEEVGENWIFHYIAEDGQQRSCLEQQLNHFFGPTSNEIRAITDIWILRHVILVHFKWAVITLDKNGLETRRLFSMPKGGDTCYQRVAFRTRDRLLILLWRSHSAVFFAISLTEKVRPNGSREVDERVKLHIWTTFEQNLPMDLGDNP